MSRARLFPPQTMIIVLTACIGISGISGEGIIVLNN